MENCNEQDCKHYYETNKPCSYIAEFCFTPKPDDQKAKSSVDCRVKVNFADIKELFLMEIEKHDNVRMGAMLAKDMQAEKTARENKKAIVDLFSKVKNKISA